MHFSSWRATELRGHPENTLDHTAPLELRDDEDRYLFIKSYIYKLIGVFKLSL
ncbi:MAG: hypothetical protein K2Q34_04555 [Alphaproteobacteria bacterium]|nr:hypothetical protein [Alphaproteobacteria bacterium]